MSFPTLEPVVLTQCGGQVPPSSTAFVHVCLAGVALPSCRVVTAAWLDRAPSILAWWLAYCCSTGPGEPAGPLPAWAAGGAKPGGGRPGAVAVGSPVDGAVGAAGSVPSQMVRKGWYICCMKDSDSEALGAPMAHTVQPGQ